MDKSETQAQEERRGEVSNCKHKFLYGPECVYCGMSFSSLQEQTIAGLVSKLEEAKREIDRLVAVNGGDGFNFPKSERQGRVDLAELAAYVREQARVADANAKEWRGYFANSNYRKGMAYAYRDILNRLDPAAYKVTVPGKEGNG